MWQWEVYIYTASTPNMNSVLCTYPGIILTELTEFMRPTIISVGMLKGTFSLNPLKAVYSIAVVLSDHFQARVICVWKMPLQPESSLEN